MFTRPRKQFLSFLLGCSLTPSALADCCNVVFNNKPRFQSKISLSSVPESRLCDFKVQTPHQIAILDDNIFVGVHMFCVGLAHGQWAHTVDLVLQLDAASGKELSHIAWLDLSKEYLREEPLQLFSHDDHLLVRVGGQLKIFSKELKEIRSKAFTSGELSPIEMWRLYVSPNSKNILLRHWRNAGSEISELHWIDSETLAEVKLESLTQEMAARVAFNDASLYYVPSDNRGPAVFAKLPAEKKRELALHKHAIGSQEFTPVCTACTGVLISLFGNEDVLLQTATGPSYEIVDKSGNIVWTKTYAPSLASAVPSSTSYSGKSIAIEYTPLLDRKLVAHNEAVLVDLENHSDTWKASFRSTSTKDSALVAPVMALSSKGILAILTGDDLAVFDIK